MPENAADEPVIRPFADWLREHSNGQSHEQLSEALHELIARVQDTGKKGSLVYTITAEPVKKADGLYQVQDRIQRKLPEHDRRTSIFYVDDDGNLTRNDPHQLAFEGMRALPDPDTDRAEVRHIREDRNS